MSFTSNSFIVNNEQLLLIDILNSMYNDNLRQINNFTTSINSLNENNTQIRNLLVQILNNPNIRNNNDRRNRRTNTFRENNINQNTNINQNNNSGLERVVLNNTPYLIDSVREYRIPYNRDNRDNNNFTRILQSFFQPVEVFPTQTQIETATRNVRYCDIVSPRNRSCPISLENFEDNQIVTVIRHCGHIFRRDDLNTWFRSHCNCPVCRYDIRDYNSNASSEFFSSVDNQNSSSYLDSSNEQETSQNRSSNFNVERNTQENLNERTRNLRDETPSILNYFLDNISNNQYDIASSLTDASGNLLNNIFNDSLSDPSTILTLLTALNNRNQR